MPVSLAPRPLASYWRDARRHRYSLLFALPLLVFYEVLAGALADPRGGGVRNGADVILTSLFDAVFGAYGRAVAGALLIGGSLFLVVRDLRSGGGLRKAVFLGMLGEAALLAVLCGMIVGQATQYLLHPLGGLTAAWLAAIQGGADSFGPYTRLMISLGAGLYEELLFRVILVAGLGQLARRAFGWRPVAAGVFATVVGAFAFSAFHYVGAYGDPLRLDSFAFRFVAGLFFSALYLTRGFGVTAWTHALYDVLVLF